MEIETFSENGVLLTLNIKGSSVELGSFAMKVADALELNQTNFILGQTLVTVEREEE